jgi:hypothetical protein
MLIDDCLPLFDFNEVHRIVIQASPERIFRSIKDLSPSEWSPVVTWLFVLRSFPERLFGKGGVQFSGNRPLLDQMLESGFVMLAETPGRELVFGTLVPASIGQFWKTSDGAPSKLSDAQEFAAFDRPDYAKVVANFLVGGGAGQDGIAVTTETRIHALSPATRKNFAVYWRVIGPGSALIRRLWLRAIKRRAERCQRITGAN